MFKSGRKQRAGLTEGRPGISLLLFALPMILGNLFQQLYNMADSMIVGNFVGEDALAAVGASYALTNVFIMVAIGGNGVSVLISQYLGAKQYGRMKTSVSTSLITFLCISLLLGGVGFGFNGAILKTLHTPDNILEQARLYLGIYFLGLPFLFMYNILAAVFNAMGDSRTPLGFLVFSSLLNVALDLFSVTWLGMGVDGVAIATVFAQGFSALLLFCLLIRRLKGYGGQEKEGFTYYDMKMLGKGDQDLGPLHPPAIHCFRGKAAGPVRGKRIRFQRAGRLLRGGTHRVHLYRAHERHGQCHGYVHGPEHRGGKDRTGQTGLQGQPHHRGGFCTDHCPGPDAF